MALTHRRSLAVKDSKGAQGFSGSVTVQSNPQASTSCTPNSVGLGGAAPTGSPSSGGSGTASGPAPSSTGTGTALGDSSPSGSASTKPSGSGSSSASATKPSNAAAGQYGAGSLAFAGVVAVAAGMLF
jgi:hypothetical protein